MLVPRNLEESFNNSRSEDPDREREEEDENVGEYSIRNDNEGEDSEEGRIEKQQTTKGKKRGNITPQREESSESESDEESERDRERETEREKGWRSNGTGGDKMAGCRLEGGT